MKWSLDRRALVDGVKLAAGFAKAKLVGREKEPLTEAHNGLATFSDFGDNPGHLRMLAYSPPAVVGQPLVVLLHGCGQDAATFARDTGWIDLAKRLRFPLILPEQAKANNAQRCFQWFSPADTTRGSGEAASIAAMTRSAAKQFGSDRKRIFVVGLSAGGAMAAALLAAYPDLFAAGASVAGMPVGTTTSVMQAMWHMAAAGPDQPPQSWAAQVHAAAPPGFGGPWPRLSVWQGQADRTVAPRNGSQLAAQWRAVHELAGPPMMEQAAVMHQSWPDQNHPLVELWSLPGLAHAYPAGTRGAARGRFVEPASVDATASIARFFGLD